MRLYLASRSPRRRELLNQIGIDFDTVVFRDGMRADSETDETPQPGESPVAYVERVARAKAIHGLKIVEERQAADASGAVGRHDAGIQWRDYRQTGRSGRCRRPSCAAFPGRPHRVADRGVADQSHGSY